MLNVTKSHVTTSHFPISTLAGVKNIPFFGVNRVSIGVNMVSTNIDMISTNVNLASTNVNLASTNANMASTDVNKREYDEFRIMQAVCQKIGWQVFDFHGNCN